jgi:hypothetical protein
MNLSSRRYDSSVPVHRLSDVKITTHNVTIFMFAFFLIYRTSSNAYIYSVHEISHSRFSGSSFITVKCNSQVKVELFKEIGKLGSILFKIYILFYFL